MRAYASRLPKWLLYIYVSCLILLPSGTVAGVPLKVPLFFALVVITSNQILRGPNGFRQMAVVMSVVGILSLWTVCSLYQPFAAAYALSQAKDLATMLAGCLIIRALIEGEGRQTHFLKFGLLVVTIGGLFKIGLLSYALATGASIQTYIDRISSTFGVTLMSLDLESAGSRLLLPSDNLIPIALFTMLTLRSRLRIHWLLALACFLILLTSSLYTFSRFIWISTIFSCLVGLLLGRKDKLNLVYISVAGLAILSFLPLIVTVVSLRFSSPLSSASDFERIWQIGALKNLFLSAPVLGHGLGSYSLVLKRSYELPYAYEVQGLAIFGQFGLVGVSFLLAILVNFYRKAFSFCRQTAIAQTVVLLLLVNLLASGFFNPSLLVSMSSVAYCMLYFLAQLNSVSQSTEGAGAYQRLSQTRPCH